jgi:hypothetical protein
MIGDGAFQPLTDQHGTPIEIAAEQPIHVALLESGMESGKPSIAFGFVLPDGRWVFAQTSMALFLTAADAFRAKAGDPRTS